MNSVSNDVRCKYQTGPLHYISKAIERLDNAYAFLYAYIYIYINMYTYINAYFLHGARLFDQIIRNFRHLPTKMITIRIDIVFDQSHLNGCYDILIIAIHQHWLSTEMRHVKSFMVYQRLSQLSQQLTIFLSERRYSDIACNFRVFFFIYLKTLQEVCPNHYGYAQDYIVRHECGNVSLYNTVKWSQYYPMTLKKKRSSVCGIHRIFVAGV